MVAPQTGRQQLRAFSADRFQTFLKPCYQKWITGYDPGSEISTWLYLVDTTRCPAFSGYPRRTHDCLVRYRLLCCGGGPSNLKLCPRGEWQDRIIIETVLSMLTLVCHFKKVMHRV
jgi:hypothetical protein